MAPREMPCAAASALKRASQASKAPEVRQSVAAEAAVDANQRYTPAASMAPRERPCAAASALKRASQASKAPEVRQSVAAEAAVAANKAATRVRAAHGCLPFRVILGAEFFECGQPDLYHKHGRSHS